MRLRTLVLAALLPLLPAAHAASPTESRAPAAAPAFQVDITKFRFQPVKLEVPAGATVTWTNHDEEPHTVTSPGGKFKGSSAMDTGDSYSVVFTKPGTYTYFCAVHPFMTATIVVK